MFGEAVLRSLNLTLSELIYSTESVNVYAGLYYSMPVVYKVVRLPRNVNYQELEKECAHMMTLTNDHIVQLVGYQWQTLAEGAFLVIILERCEKDLSKDMKDRKKNNFPFSEEEMRKAMTELISTLAAMQEQGLAHRDLKPENIYISKKSLKIGDFGSSRFSEEDAMYATLTGTPLYLSPLLREGFTTSSSKVTHNIFKSDVYSLGLTFLAMARLEPPIFVLTNNAQLQQVAMNLRYSTEVTRTILWMLTNDESARPDFVQLNQWISQAFFLQQSAPAESYFQSTQPVQVESSIETSGSNNTDMIQISESSSVSEEPSGASFQQKEEPLRPSNPEYSKTIETIEAKSSSKHWKTLQHGQPIKREKEDILPIRKTECQQKSDDRKCLFCNQVIDINSSYIQPVQLKCKPNNYMFYSVDCFQKSIREQGSQRREPRCQACHVIIDEDNRIFFVCLESKSLFSSFIENRTAFIFFVIAFFLFVSYIEYIFIHESLEYWETFTVCCEAISIIYSQYRYKKRKDSKAQ